jgi:hypothetical protein
LTICQMIMTSQMIMASDQGLCTRSSEGVSELALLLVLIRSQFAI